METPFSTFSGSADEAAMRSFAEILGLNDEAETLARGTAAPPGGLLEVDHFSWGQPALVQWSPAAAAAPPAAARGGYGAGS